MNDIYLISPAMMAALQSAIIANYTSQNQPVVLYQLGQDENSNFKIAFKAYGETRDEVHKLCSMAERNYPVLLSPRSHSSRWVGVQGESWQFKGLLYHVGCRTNNKYGMQYIHRFLDEVGNEVTWTTSKLHPLGKYNVSCRIKEFNRYSGVEQTAVTYCKLERID